MSLFVEDSFVTDAADGEQVLALTSAMFVEVFRETTCQDVSVILVCGGDEHISTFNSRFDQGLTIEHVAVQDQHIEGLSVFHGP